jgi:DNA-directed RNA polymerase subunit RPC12/RpoP
MINLDDVLVRCPRCEAWPMAVTRAEEHLSRSSLTYRCPHCGAEQNSSRDESRLRRATPAEGKPAHP